MMWWQSSELRRDVVAKCMDSAAPVESAGVVMMALHGAGRDRLVELSKSGAVDVDQVVPVLAELDVSDLVEQYARVVGADDASWFVVKAHWEAAEGARSTAKSLVSKGVPAPVAVERAAAAYGVGAGQAPGFVESMSKAATPLVVTDAGLRAVHVWADRVAQEAPGPALEGVSKDQFVRRGRLMDQPRDEDGEFSSGKAKAQRGPDGQGEAEKEKAVPGKRSLADIRRDNQARAKKQRGRRDQRDQREQRLEEKKKVEAVAEQGSVARRKLKDLAGEARVSAVESAELERKEKRVKRLSRKKRVERVAYNQEALKSAQASALKALKAAPLSDDGGIDWDPKPMPDRAFNSFFAEDKYDSAVVDDSLYVQVPLDVVFRAFHGTVPEDGQSHAGPRISVQAASEYMGRPLTVRRMRKRKDQPLFSDPDREAALFVEVNGKKKALAPMPAIGLGDFGEPVMNIHVPAAWAKGWEEGSKGELEAELAPFVSILAGRPFEALAGVRQFLVATGQLDEGEDLGDPEVWNRVLANPYGALDEQEVGMRDDADKMVNKLVDALYPEPNRATREWDESDDYLDPAARMMELQAAREFETQLRSGVDVSNDIPSSLNRTYQRLVELQASLTLLEKNRSVVTKKIGLPAEQVMPIITEGTYPGVDSAIEHNFHDMGVDATVLMSEAHLAEALRPDKPDIEGYW